MTSAEEMLDLVDDKDQVVGQIGRKQYYQSEPRPGFVRSVNLFLINSSGKIFVPSRALTHHIKPGALDFSAGGHVSAGETYEESLQREAEEELGLRVNPAEFVFIGKLTPRSKPGREHYFSNFYALFSDAMPHYGPEEFSGHEWLTPHEFQARLTAGADAKDSILDGLNLLLRYQLQHASNEKRDR